MLYRSGDPPQQEGWYFFEGEAKDDNDNQLMSLTDFVLVSEEDGAWVVWVVGDSSSITLKSFDGKWTGPYLTAVEWEDGDVPMDDKDLAIRFWRSVFHYCAFEHMGSSGEYVGRDYGENMRMILSRAVVSLYYSGSLYSGNDDTDMRYWNTIVEQCKIYEIDAASAISDAIAVMEEELRQNRHVTGETTPEDDAWLN